MELQNSHATHALPLSSRPANAGFGRPGDEGIMPAFPKDEKEKVIYYSTPAIAERWACSQNKVISVLEGHRGEKGFMDLGSPENLKDT